MGNKLLDTLFEEECMCIVHAGKDPRLPSALLEER